MHEDSLRPRASRRRAAQRGHTLLEMAVATATMGLVFGGSMLLLNGTRGAFQQGSNRSSLQEVGRRILDDVLSDIRRSGLTSAVGQAFPAIWERPAGPLGQPRGNLIADMDYQDVGLVDEVLARNGDGCAPLDRVVRNQNRMANEFAYQLPADLNGNGMPIDDNGVLTWGPEQFSFRILTDPNDGIQTLHRITETAGVVTRQERVGRWVQNITFDVVFNDRSLRFGEVAVVIYLQRVNGKGEIIRVALEGSVALRNTREL